MSLGGLKGKIGLKASPAQKEAKRPRLALGDDEEDDSGKQQEISGWDAAEGGAVDISGPKVKEAPRVIPALPNRNWRDEARRKQLAKAPHVQAQNGTVVEHTEAPKIQFGLTILKKDEPQDNGAEEAAAPAEPMEDVKDGLTEEQRLEKKALDSLLSGKSADDDFVIPIQSEEEALHNELRAAPDVPSLDAYEATPIEGFGAAMLRGMGWKGDDANGDSTSTKPKEVKRRPALLGIGAKAEAAEGVELGTWGGKPKGKGKKQLVETYNPVTLRNKVTGELITEEELNAKLEQQDMVQEEKPERERRKYSDEEEDDRTREKRRDRRDNRDRRRDDDDNDSGRRRDRDRKDDRYDSDRRRDKRKDKYRDEDYDSERRREKRRDKDDDGSSSRRDKGKDRERRDRSRSPDSDRRDKKHDRYRSRSRDSRKDGSRRERSRDSDDRRKRRREKEYDDDREDRKRRHKNDKY